MKTVEKLFVVLSVVLLSLFSTQVFAEDYTYTQSSGTHTLTLTTTTGTKFKVNGGSTVYTNLGDITVKGGTLNIVFNTTNSVLSNGEIKVEKGIVNLSLGSNITDESHSTLKRASDYTGRLFYVNRTTSSTARLNITGKSETVRFMVHGNCTGFQVVPNSSGRYQATHGSGAVLATQPLILLKGGTLDMDYVTLLNNWDTVDRGGAINMVDGDYINTVLMDYCTIRNCYCEVSGAAIRIQVNSGSSEGVSAITMRNCMVYNNFVNCNAEHGPGGIIRTYASSRCNLTMTDCEVRNNYAACVGGSNASIFCWNAFVDEPLKLTRCTFDGNWTAGNGGAMTIMSNVIMKSCTITNNTALKNGGGIYYQTYNCSDHNPTLNPTDSSIDLDASTVIENNSADLGGGMYMLIKTITNGGYPEIYNPSGDTITINLNVNGAKIRNNSSTNGGGVYMIRTDMVYHSSINLNYGDIADNTASSLGGGIYATGGIAINVGKASIADSLKVISNRARNGGGIYISDGNVVVNKGFVGLQNKPNISNGGNGGAIYVNNGNITVNGGEVNYNQAKRLDNSGGNGGAFYASGGKVTVTGGSVSYNSAEMYGGGFYVNAASNTAVTTVKGGVTVAYNTAVNGGGAYVSQGKLVIQDAATNITADTARTSGGGIYMAGGTVTFTNSKLQGNVAESGFGGGMYLGANSSNSMTVSGSEAAIKGNRAFNQGGGVYVGGGTFTMTGGAIGGALADGNFTTSADSYGGGLYMNGGTATISNCSISGNYTCSRDPDDLSGCGGAVYMNGGSCLLKGGSAIGGVPELNDPDDPDDDLYYTNISKYGGGIYSANGTITVKGGAIGYNSAEKGGGIYSNGSKAKVYVQKDSSKADVLSYIEHNTAEYGGGIYGEKGRVEFSDGYIQYNTASQQGGGIYVDANDTLYLKGSANLVLNGVPTNHKGGGVYLVGSLIVGEQTTPLGTIMARSNYAYTTTQPDTLLTSGGDVAEDIRNNVFLPNPVVHTYTENTHAGVIEVVEDGISTASHVGFSVLHGNVPVIYCTRSSGSWNYLHQFSTGQPLQYNLFDDSGRYRSVQYSNDPAFDPDHVYLYGFWSDEVTGGDGDYCVVDKTIFTNHQNDTIPITTPCELAYFISWVNGREDPTHLDPHPGANAKLMDDIDMSEFGWVPIGTEANPYSGVFNGNGHTVSGIRSLLNDYHTDYGFFGKLASGAKVKDLFLIGSSFHIEKKGGYSGTMYIGGVAGRTSGNATIQNCEASGILFVEPENTNSVIGGLVGKTNSGDKIHSSIGIADISGFLMGGLVGQNSGELLNSFANAQFSSLTGNTQYYGGLVAENSGTVENCYVRLRGTVPAASAKFGLLAGLNNTGAEVKYCYSSADGNYFKSDSGTALGYGWFADTQVPYLYARRDNQVTLAQSTNPYKPTQANPNPDLAVYGVDMQMVRFLNAWVAQKNGSTSTYAYWKRPTTKAINNDLPILKMPHSNINAVYCAGNTDGTEDEIYLNYGEINDILATQRQAGEAIWLYKNKDNMAGNNGSDAKLYIDEGVTVRQVADLYAYVGVTLDNSANAGGAHPTFPNSQGQYITDYTDWHMFSTPLANAPLGVNYKGDTNPYSSGDFSQPGHPDGMPYYQFYDNEEAASGDEDWERRGYFPSHVYNSTYTDDNTGETTGGNYYREWDFYTYFEPEYHWVNFKRNSNSHWHQNAPTTPIEYTHYDSQASATVAGNETVLTQGRGYLVATREETFLQCHGLLNGTSGQVSIPVTYSGYYSPGYNFLGNPYLAYLDFDEFARVNKVLWGGGTDTDFTASYAVIDEDEGGYIYRAIRCSANPNTAPQYIAPHQGFMILAVEDIEDDAAAVFYPNMRDLNGDGGHFRGEEQPAYPLVNLIATDDNGNRDIATVELGRPDRGGAPLMRELRQCKGHVWCHYEGKDWAIAFTQPGLTEAAIRFETFEDGEYTMRWNTQNGDFSYLHLIDNMTGADIDCLATDEYRFASTTMDYKSRFRLVFGYTGIEEPEGDDPAQGSFAYQSGDELVVTGEGTVELFDVTGRRMSAERIEGVQGTMSVSGLTPGVYLLRLNTATGTRVQKIVINQ